MSKGWFLFAVNVFLTAFTMATIILAVFWGDDKHAVLSAATVDAIPRVSLIILILVQAPFLGQVRETKRVESALEEERGSHAKIQEDMKALLAEQVADLLNPGTFCGHY